VTEAAVEPSVSSTTIPNVRRLVGSGCVVARVEVVGPDWLV
jgi:hypothetical protein